MNARVTFNLEKLETAIMIVLGSFVLERFNTVTATSEARN